MKGCANGLTGTVTRKTMIPMRRKTMMYDDWDWWEWLYAWLNDYEDEEVII